MNESIGGLDSEHMRVRMLIFGWTKHLKLWLSKTTSKHKTGQMVCVVRKKTPAKYSIFYTVKVQTSVFVLQVKSVMQVWINTR